MFERSDETKTVNGWLDFVLINGMTLAVLALWILSSGCGIIIGNPDGNPTAMPSGSPLGAPGDAFDDPASEYAPRSAKDCGLFTNESSSADIEAGRSCIRTALLACEEAKYLLDETNADETRFTSYVTVELTSNTPPIACQLRVHTVSTDPSRFIGDREAACMSLASDELPELACGIGN